MLDRKVKYLKRKCKYKLPLSFSNTCFHTWTDCDFDKILQEHCKHGEWNNEESYEY